jgi:type IV pilus assembly protein PilN
MVRINLLPIREILRKRELKQFAFIAGAIVAVAFGVMALGYSYVQMRIGSLESDKQVRNRELASLKKKNKEINKLKEELARLKKQVDTIERLTKSRDTPAPFMAALSTVIPDEIYVKSIEKRGKGFSIDGIGPDNTTVVNFVQRLQKLSKDFEPGRREESEDKKNSPFFSNVKLVEVISGGAKAARGSMVFKVTGNIR